DGRCRAQGRSFAACRRGRRRRIRPDPGWNIVGWIVMMVNVDALVLLEPRRLAINTRTCPPPGPEDVVIAPRTVGICGSDLHLFREGRIGDSVVRAPLVLGHEAAGVVVAVGDQVVDLR